VTRPLLDDIALHRGTDKSSDHHHYTRLYEFYFNGFSPVRNGSLLELGVKQGASMAMWRDWLPGWTIQGIDNGAEGEPVLMPGTRLGIGDQSDPDFLNGIAATSGPFDIIIDDASHLSSLSIASFTILWPHLKPGGWYVVEDTHSSYHDFYYGKTEANPDPSYGIAGEWERSEPAEVITMMGFLKRIADEANYRGPDDLFPQAHWLGFDVEAVHFHFNICFVQKRS
jgi:hypothetical protein